MVVELANQVHELGQNHPKGLSVDRVEGFRQVYEDGNEVHILFDALLQHLAYREDHVGGAAAWTGSTLGFRRVFLRDVGDKAVEDDASPDLPCEGQERDAPAVAAVNLTAPVLNRETNVAFLNSSGTSSSSQMLVRSEWSASRATGPADLKISAGIPSIPEDFPELVCLIAFETSSIVVGRSRMVITGFCGIWSSTVATLTLATLPNSLLNVHYTKPSP